MILLVSMLIELSAEDDLGVQCEEPDKDNPDESESMVVSVTAISSFLVMACGANSGAPVVRFNIPSELVDAIVKGKLR